MAVSIICSLTVVSASAESENQKYTPAMLFLNTYLSDLRDGKLDEAYKYTYDTRYELTSDTELSKLNNDERSNVDYIERGQAFKDSYNEEAITSYHILEELDNNIVTPKIKFSNGNEAVVPFNVIENDNGFIIKITLDDLSENGFVQSKTVIGKVDKEGSINSVKASGILKDEYEFSYLYGTIYGIDIFSVNNRGAIRIDGYQANDMISSGWTAKASVIYSIVEKHWYGDDVWATTSNPIVKNGNFSVTIIGKNSSQSNLRIRISNQTGANPRSKGHGQIFAVSV